MLKKLFHYFHQIKYVCKEFRYFTKIGPRSPEIIENMQTKICYL